jgi:ADP-heptose:LPS heptosyltransferase
VSAPVVLALRALGLGDLLTAVPALRGIRRLSPTPEIVLAAPRRFSGLMATSRAVDHVLHAPDLVPLPALHPAVAVDLHGWGLASQRILADTMPGRLVAFGGVPGGVAGPAYAREEHEVSRWCRLVTEGMGASADPRDLALPKPDVLPSLADAIVIHPGAAYPARRWGGARYARVAAALADGGRRVVVTGSEPELALASEVVRLGGLPSDALLAGRLTVMELAALVAHAQLVVCGDTGVAHLASAYGTPSIVLFGPVSPARWGPPADGPHRVIWHGDDHGDPWGKCIDPSLDRITVQEVLAEIGALREEIAA